MTVRLLLIAEVEVDIPPGTSERDTPYVAEQLAVHMLDGFREAVLPSQNYNICFYRAPQSITREDYL